MKSLQILLGSILLFSLTMTACGGKEAMNDQASNSTVAVVTRDGPQTSADSSEGDAPVLSADLGDNPTLPATDLADTGDDPSQSVDLPTKAPKGFAIQGIKAEGDACPADSFATNISPDQKAFTVTFSQFGVDLEAGMKKATKSCRLSLKLLVPAGWQYSVASFNSRGFMALDEGIEAIHATRYYFKGHGHGGGFRHKEVGELAKDYVYTDKIGLLSVRLSHEWSPCKGSRDLQIETAIKLKNTNPKLYPDATGLISNDSIDGEIKQLFGLSWRHCK